MLSFNDLNVVDINQREDATDDAAADDVDDDASTTVMTTQYNYKSTPYTVNSIYLIQLNHINDILTQLCCANHIKFMV